MGQSHQSENIEPDLLIFHVKIEIAIGPNLSESRIVHQQLKAGIVADFLFDQLEIGWIRQIGRQNINQYSPCVTENRCERLKPLTPPGNQDHIITITREALCERLANAR